MFREVKRVKDHCTIISLFFKLGSEVLRGSANYLQSYLKNAITSIILTLRFCQITINVQEVPRRKKGWRPLHYTSKYVRLPFSIFLQTSFTHILWRFGFIIDNQNEIKVLFQWRSFSTIFFQLYLKYNLVCCSS